MKPEPKKQDLFLTQEDIDTALRAVDVSKTAIDADDTEALVLDEADIIDPDSEDLEYFGLLSKDDIEALLHGDLLGSQGKDTQDEIDSLLAATGSGNGPTPASAGLRPGNGNAAQDDVERLIQKTVAGVHEKVEPVATMLPEEKEAISQDDIDRLLMSAIDEPGEDAEHDLEAVPGGSKEEGVVSQDDIDRLLMGDTARIDAETEMNFEGGPNEILEPPTSRNDSGNLFSQVDQDPSSGETPVKGGAKETLNQGDDTPQEHISQSDINRLLKESLEEEDFQKEEEGVVPDAILEAEAIEPVILAADEEVHEPTPPAPELPSVPRPRKKAARRFNRKRLITGVAAGIVLILGVSMMMPSGQEEAVLQPRVLTFSVPQSDGVARSAWSVSAKSVYLKGFIILAPSDSAAFTYMTGDLLLGLSDASFIGLIKENEAYVRDIIYGTLNRELMTRDLSTIDEISLELAIRKELGRIIPRGAIERIDFERFSLA